MAKAIKAWFGTDTYGRHVEVAQREDGKFFARHEHFNGYAKANTPWYSHNPTFETHGVNAYSGEEFEYSEPQLFWGFNKMSCYANAASGDKINLRLPN